MSLWFSLTCRFNNFLLFLRYDTTLADACITLSQRWIKVRQILYFFNVVYCWFAFGTFVFFKAKEQDLCSFKASDVKTLSSHQLIEFLTLLLQEVNLHSPFESSPRKLCSYMCFYFLRMLSLSLMWRGCRMSMVSMPVQTQRFAAGECFSRASVDPSSLWSGLPDRLVFLQVAEAECAGEVGGSSSLGTEDGNRTGKDEVHQTFVQVLMLFWFHLSPWSESSCSSLCFCFPSREVFNFEKYRDEAVRVFVAHRAAMHPITAGLVAKDLKVDDSSSSSL